MIIISTLKEAVVVNNDENKWNWGRNLPFNGSVYNTSPN